MQDCITFTLAKIAFVWCHHLSPRKEERDTERGRVSDRDASSFVPWNPGMNYRPRVINLPSERVASSPADISQVLMAESVI